MKKQFLLFSFTLTLLFSNFSFTQSSPTHDKYVVGYFAQWAIYGRDYNVSDIKAENLTHLMYAFYDTQFDMDTGLSMIKTLDGYADTGHTEDPGVDHSSELQGNFGAIKILKEQYPYLKVLISLGGWTKSLAFPDLAASQTGRESLADAMVTFINTYPFIDGFDIDWEFPVYGGIDNPKQPNTPDDHRNLVYLLKEMRETFDLEFPEERKLVTMAGGNNVFTLLSTHVGPGTQSYHGMSESISDYCDFITFFGYDLGGNWYDKTSYNAPLYPSNNREDPLYRFRLTTPGEGEPGIDDNGDGVDDLFDRMNMDRGITPTPPVPQLSLDDLINLYLNYLEIPKEKLILGVPFYGRLFDNVDHGEVEAGLPGLFRSAPRHTSTGCPGGLHSPQGSWDGMICEQSGSIGFSDQTIGESCISSNNGKIIVTIKNVFLYTITISNDNTSTSQVFSGYTWTSDDLEAGNYKICFTIDGKPGYEKCFEVQISEPESLSVYSSVNTDTNVLSLSLSVSQNYQVTLNQKTFQTSNQQLEIPIAKGINKLHIKTDKECQGSYTEEIFNSEEVLVYPNPTASEVFIYIGGKDEEATLSIKSIRGRELYQKTHTIAVDRQTSISLGDFEEGIYFISIDGKTTKQKVKIIKK